MNISLRHLMLALIMFTCPAEAMAAQDDVAEQPDIDSLVNELSSEYYCRREYALEELIEHAGAATPAMLAALESRDYQARNCAVRFFAAKGTSETAPRLLDVLKKSNEVEVVTGLTRLLSRLEFKDALGHIRVLVSHESSKVRAEAVNALVRLDDRESVKEIAALIRDDFSEARIAAAGALSAFHATEFGEDVLAQFRKEKIPDAQRALVECLGELKVKEAVPLLVEAIKDEDSPIFLQAVRALAGIGGEKARDALIDLLMRSDDLELLDISSSAVGRIGEGAIPVLEGKLKGLAQDSDDRWKIMNAYWKMGRYVIPHFIKFLAAETYPFYKDRASLMMLEIVKREYDIALNRKDYRLIYDEPFEEWKRKTENWKKWWEEHKDD